MASERRTPVPSPFRSALIAGATAGLILLSLLSAPIVAAHGHTSASGFNVVMGWGNEPAPADLEFPVKEPPPPEGGTRPNRIDSRTAAPQSAAPAPGAIADAHAAAAAAAAAADRALLIGVILGGAGLILAVVAIAMVL